MSSIDSFPSPTGCRRRSARRARCLLLFARVEKTRRFWLALCVLLFGTLQASAQNVSLGTASFTNASSDQAAAEWYWPLPNATSRTYEGYGAFAGAIRTETYTRGESIAGVKTVRWHLETKTVGLATPIVEDWWLAFDVANNLCVLQVVLGGTTAFTASAQVTPPVWLPGKPVAGEKWDFLGLKLSVEDVSASLHTSSVLKLSIEVPDQPVRHKTYSAGTGVIQDAESERPRPTGSGWMLQRK